MLIVTSEKSIAIGHVFLLLYSFLSHDQNVLKTQISNKNCIHNARDSRPFFFYGLHAFFIRNPFISNGKLKLAKNQANAKQHPEADLLLFENYSHSSFILSSKNKSTYKK